MALLEINPRYRDFLERHQLLAAPQFLALPGTIIGGHPERHVARVQLGSGAEAVTAFLKREHRVLRRTRLANLWAGFGCISHSRREAQLLRALHSGGVHCPDWIAAGEDDQGRAFILVREVPNAQELRVFLRSPDGRTPPQRRQLARIMGETLAHMHEMGFEHPDLYCKHILVDAAQMTVHILDWQRSRQHRLLDWPRRWRDLAALHATLADELALPRDRLAFFRAYLRAALPMRAPRTFRHRALSTIAFQAKRLLRHRHIGELRQAPLDDRQQLIWLDGEAVCVTPEVHQSWAGRAPAWLAAPGQAPDLGDQVTRITVAVPGVSQATLIRRRTHWPLSWRWAWLWGRRVIAPEVRTAGILFRLQRYGVATPRLLAFGQRHSPPHRTESFLLTESSAGHVSLSEWLALPAGRSLWSAELKQRRARIRQAAAVLRSMHETGCFLTASAAAPLAVRSGRIVLANVEAVETCRHGRWLRARRDLAGLLPALPPLRWSQSDSLRLVLAYLKEQRVTPAVRRLGRLILRKPSLLDTLRALLIQPANAERAEPVAVRRAAG